jgi:hypothetical protein
VSYSYDDLTTSATYAATSSLTDALVLFVLFCFCPPCLWSSRLQCEAEKIILFLSPLSSFCVDERRATNPLCPATKEQGSCPVMLHRNGRVDSPALAPTTYCVDPPAFQEIEGEGMRLGFGAASFSPRGADDSSLVRAPTVEPITARTSESFGRSRRGAGRLERVDQVLVAHEASA